MNLIQVIMLTRKVSTKLSDSCVKLEEEIIIKYLEFQGLQVKEKLKRLFVSSLKFGIRKFFILMKSDKYRGDLPKEKVEAKMGEINQAYEVLSNEGNLYSTETRAAYKI